MVTWYNAHRPAVMGASAMVSSTHYLATTAGLETLKAGGNAADAGVAAGLCINVLEPHLTNLGGVAPIMYYEAASGHVGTISGLGRWPAAASIEWFQERHGGDMPEGIPRTVVPAAAGAWLDALARHGTMTFAIAAWFTWQLIELQLPYRTPGSGLPNAAFTTPLLLGLVGLIVVLLKQLAEHAPAARAESGGTISQ